MKVSLEAKKNWDSQIGESNVRIIRLIISQPHVCCVIFYLVEPSYSFTYS